MQSTHWQLDDYGVLNKLLYNESLYGGPEDLFRVLGFVHLYTASGIHLYAFLNALEHSTYFFARLLGVKSIGLKRLQKCIGLIAILFLWKLQAWRIGFARPIFILLLRALAKEKGMRWRLFYPLFITLLLDYLFKIESGRLHYYLAVGGGLWALDWVKDRFKTKSLFVEHAAMAIGSWIPIAAYDLCTHHVVSWATPFWSLFTLPLISSFLFPLTLANLALTGGVSSLVIDLWNQFLSGCLWFVDHGFTFLMVSRQSVWMGGIAASIFMMLVFLFRRHAKASRVVGCGFFLAVLFGIRLAAPPALDSLRISQLDVKQGDSLVITNRDRIEMIDVGSKRAWSNGRWLLKLAEHGADHVDTVLLSHLDEDHCGELHRLATLVPVGAVELNANLWKSKKGIKLSESLAHWSPQTRFCNENCMNFASVRWFRSSSKKHSGNDLMAGVVVPLDEKKAYFALGDGDESQEDAYLQSYREEIKRYPYRIWKVGHHGSRFSSGENFLRGLKPSELWISVGRKNSYHHPHPLAMLRLMKTGARIRRTDEEGDLLQVSDTFWNWGALGKVSDTF